MYIIILYPCYRIKDSLFSDSNCAFIVKPKCLKVKLLGENFFTQKIRASPIWKEKNIFGVIYILIFMTVFYLWKCYFVWLILLFVWGKHVIICKDFLKKLDKVILLPKFELNLNLKYHHFLQILDIFLARSPSPIF